jgi:hypothetical protein
MRSFLTNQFKCLEVLLYGSSMHDSSLVIAVQIMTSPYRIMSINYCNLLCKLFYALPRAQSNSTRLGLHPLLLLSGLFVWLVTSITSGQCLRHLVYALKLTICLSWCMDIGEARPSSQPSKLVDFYWDYKGDFSTPSSLNIYISLKAYW